MPARLLEDGSQTRRLLHVQNERYRFNFGIRTGAEEDTPEGGDEGDAPTQDASPFFHRLITVHKIDFIMLILAFLSLLVAVVFSTVYETPLVKTWYHFLVFDNRQTDTATSASARFGTVMKSEYCQLTNKTNPFQDISTSFDMYTQQAIHVTSWSRLRLNMWNLLMCGVIVPSVLFQGYRCTGYYRPESGPHLGRWVEYMITSPVQVVFVALAFHIREVDLLVCLWAMQFSMVLTGYSIEREIASLSTNSDRWKRAGLIVIFLTSVLVHFVIWSVIYARLRTEQGVVDACASAVFSGDASSNAAKLKTALDAVFWGQALLFTLFIIPPV